MSEAAAFDALLEEYYPVWLRFHPESAQAVGDYRFADRFRAADDDDIGALLSWLESLLVSLEELDFGALDGDRQLDTAIHAVVPELGPAHLFFFRAFLLTLVHGLDDQLVRTGRYRDVTRLDEDAAPGE